MAPRWARDLYASPPTPLLLILGPIVLLHVLVEQFRRWWRGAPKHLPPCADAVSYTHLTLPTKRIV